MAFDNINTGDKVGTGFDKANNSIDKIVIGGSVTNGVLKLSYNDTSFLDIPLPVVSAGVAILTQSGSVDITGSDPNCFIDVPALEYSYNGDIQSIASTQFAFIAPDPTDDRLDVIYLDPVTNIYGYTQGTPALSPAIPNIPVGTVNIATIYVYGGMPCETSKPIYSAIAEQMAQIIIDLTVALEGMGVATDSRLAPWDVALNYFTGDVCQIDGVFYKALQNSLGADPILGAPDWEEIEAGGSFIYDAVAYVDTNATPASGVIGDIAKPFQTVNEAITAFAGANLKVVVLDAVCNFGSVIDPSAKKIYIDAPHVDVSTTGTIYSSALNFDITIRSKTRAHTGVLDFAVGGATSFLRDETQEVIGITAQMLTGGTYRFSCERIFTSGNPIANVSNLLGTAFRSDTSGAVHGVTACNALLDLGIGTIDNRFWNNTGELDLTIDATATNNIPFRSSANLKLKGKVTSTNQIIIDNCNNINGDYSSCYVYTGAGSPINAPATLNFRDSFIESGDRNIFNFGGGLPDNCIFDNVQFHVNRAGGAGVDKVDSGTNTVFNNCQVFSYGANTLGIIGSSLTATVQGTSVSMPNNPTGFAFDNVTMLSGNSTDASSNAGDPTKFLAQDGTYLTPAGGGGGVTSAVELSMSVAQAWASGVETKIGFNTATNDVGGDFNTGTNIFTAPSDGWYQVNVNFEGLLAAAGKLSCRIYGDGTLRACGSDRSSVASTLEPSTSAVFNLTTGQEIEFRSFQDSGFACTGQIGCTFASIIKIG